jgi:hypothetical protein
VLHQTVWVAQGDPEEVAADRRIGEPACVKVGTRLGVAPIEEPGVRPEGGSGVELAVGGNGIRVGESNDTVIVGRTGLGRSPRLRTGSARRTGVGPVRPVGLVKLRQ